MGIMRRKEVDDFLKNNKLKDTVLISILNPISVEKVYAEALLTIQVYSSCYRQCSN